MNLSQLAIAAAIAAASIPAQAQSVPAGGKGLYGEIGYTSLNYKGPVMSLSPMGAVRVILGYNLMENLAIDGMVAAGAGDGSTTVSGVAVKGRLDSGYGIYLKPKTKLSESIEVFGRLGYANTKSSATASVPGFTASASSSSDDFSYGVGASVKVTKDMSVNLDYMSYYNKNSESVNGFTLGLGFNF